MTDLVRLTILLGALSVIAAATGITLLVNSSSSDARFEVAKWLLGLSTVLFGAGVLGAVLRLSDLTRARRESWARHLQDVVAAHDTAQLASRLLPAHATAKTYSEQMVRINEVRGILRRITTSEDLHDEPRLRNLLKAMRGYLKELTLEYNKNYLPVARQQRLDEAVLDVRLKQQAAASTAPDFPLVPAELAGVLPAGRALEDIKRFPFLHGFRYAFEETEFRKAYEAAKPILEEKAGVRRRRA